MSATMRTTLQTVPESLPADHVTNASGTTASTPTAPTESKPHIHTNPSTIKTRHETRSSSTKVSENVFFLLYFAVSF